MMGQKREGREMTEEVWYRHGTVRVNAALAFCRKRIRELEIRAEEAEERFAAIEREVEVHKQLWREAVKNLEQDQATLMALREWREKWAASQLTFEAADELDTILDGEGEK